MNGQWQFPRFRFRAFSVWHRNLLVWRKLIGPAVLMNFGEPLLYLLGLGYGLSLFVGTMDDIPYLTFLASGVVASSTMMTASFEAMYSVFTRMIPQRTYEAIMVTPLELDDILAGEALWCATKGMFSTTAILLVAWLLGAVAGPWAVLAIPVGFLIGLSFAGMGIAMSALSPNYDFFSYYFTLVITPMFILSGVFYPVETLPEAVQWLVQLLPLYHAVALVRPLVAGFTVEAPLLHIGVLLIYAILGYYLAVVLTRRRLLV